MGWCAETICAAADVVWWCAEAICAAADVVCTGTVLSVSMVWWCAGTVFSISMVLWCAGTVLSVSMVLWYAGTVLSVSMVWWCAKTVLSVSMVVPGADNVDVVSDDAVLSRKLCGASAAVADDISEGIVSSKEVLGTGAGHLVAGP